MAGMLGGRLDHEWANLFELVARARGFAGISDHQREQAAVLQDDDPPPLFLLGVIGAGTQLTDHGASSALWRS